MNRIPLREVEAPCPTVSCPERIRRFEDLREMTTVWQHGKNLEAVFLAERGDLIEWGEVELQQRINVWLQQIHAMSGGIAWNAPESA